MKQGMESYIKKNKVLHCILKIIKNRKNTQFLNGVLSSGQNPEFLILGKEHLEIKQGKCYLLIDLQAADVGSRGFCAILRYILAGYCIADSLEMIPYVNVEGSLYNVPGGWRGCNNMYHYYFEAPELTIKEIKEQHNYIQFRTRNIDLVYNAFSGDGEASVDGYHVTDAYLREMGRVMNQYVRLKGELKEQFGQEIKNLFLGKRVLGVHIRGTDFNAGWEKHPIAVKAEAYFNYIDGCLEKDFDAVFLATDDESILESCKEKYSDRLLFYQDTYRSDNGIALHMKKSERRENEYYLGLELLRDLYTLAACDGLISGLSQVSFCARIMKYAKGEEYPYLEVINHGINLWRDQEKVDSYKKKLSESGSRVTS